MAKLAIKGHETRGNEVIKILEMLGAKNGNGCNGNYPYKIYYINEYNLIEACDKKYNFEYAQYSLEEFLEKFPYKIGDKAIDTKTNKVVEIYNAHWSESNNCTYYDVKLSNNTGCVRSHKFLQPYKEETIKGKITMNEGKGTLVAIDLTQEIKKANEIEVILGDYEFVLKDGKTYFIKKNKYPKTYEECCDVLSLGEDGKLYTKGYKASLIQEFQKLIICRDAYWKIAGEQMGLGKPWEPNWLNVEQDKFVLYTHNNVICSNCFMLGHNVLAFPTAEIRDAFYEYFKDLIEQCKEFL